MSWKAYRAFLVVAALLAGFLIALPIWDWLKYRQARLESPSVNYLAPAGAEAHPTAADAIMPRAGSSFLSAALAAPRNPATAPSRNDAQVVRQAHFRTNGETGPRIGAPALERTSERAVHWRPPVSEGESPSVEAGAVAGAVQPPANTSPLAWFRSLPIQAPRVAPSTEKRPPPAGSSSQEPEQDVSDPPLEPRRSSEKNAPRLSLLPSLTTVAYGKTVSLQVVLTGGEGITSVPFHLRFDPALFEFLGAHTGTAFLSSSLDPLLLASVNPERPGDLAVGLALIGDSRAFSGSGSLVVLDFRAIGRGRTDLTFENSSVRGITSEPLPAEFANTTIQID